MIGEPFILGRPVSLDVSRDEYYAAPRQHVECFQAWIGEFGAS